jgi:hypothetical protein
VIGIGVAGGLLIAFFGLRTAEQRAAVFDSIDGTLKEDWARTGKIDFHVVDPHNPSPQSMILRVEERKLIENAVGQVIVQLRWRLATIEEAKDVVIIWNRARLAEIERRGSGSTAVLGLARAAS